MGVLGIVAAGVVFDSAVAEWDKRQLRAACDHLEQAINYLKKCKTNSVGLTGNAGNAIADKAQILNSDMQTRIDEAEAAYSQIKTIIDRYNEAARQLQSAVQSTGNSVEELAGSILRGLGL